MYEMARRPTMGALPGWLNSLISDVKGVLLKGTQVSVPTDAGTVTIDLSKPGAFEALQKMISGIKVTRTPSPTPATPAAPSPVDAIPGGWLTIAGVGLLALLMLRRR